MGYKDDKWREAPGYCVECGNLRPLDKSAVCQECYNAHPNSWYKPWEEDKYNSQWYYKGARRADALESVGESCAGKKEFVIFGDYKQYSASRADFKIFDFIIAETPEEAFQLWKESLGDNGQEIAVLEEEVFVMEIEGTRWVFDLITGGLSQRYRRADLLGT